MVSYEPVLESYRAADHPAHWTLVTNDHEIRWPAKFTLRADGEMNPRTWPYELALDGSRENLLWLQGPLRGKQIPTVEHLVAPGMAIAARGELNGSAGTVRWMEVAYEKEGTKWRQRSYWLPVDSDSQYLLRAQGTLDVSGVVFSAADVVATTFRPRPGGRD